ncbi:MAG: universal stress protein [Pseudomonadota bacterium]
MLRMLVLTDGSEGANHAVRHAMAQIPLYREPVEIHLLNVQLPIASGNVRKFFSHEELNSYYQDEGLAALAGARKLLDAAGVPYHYHVGVGDIAETVARYAAEKQCGQVVMGTRGMGGLANVLLGSVAAKVIHAVSVPVVLVK